MNVPYKEVTSEKIQNLKNLIKLIKEKKKVTEKNIKDLKQAIEMITKIYSDKHSQITCELIECLHIVFCRMYLKKLKIPKYCDKNM